MIEVRSKSGALRCKVAVTSKCVYYKTLMEEEYILLSFESDTLVGFQKKDAIVTDFGTFRIMEVAKPQRQSDGGYLYEQKFVADWMFWANRILFYNRQSGFEKSWKMTQRPEYFMAIVVDNLKNAGFGTYTYEIDSALTEMKLVSFDSTSIIDALTAIAEAWDSEWWITDTTIHISKCEYGSAVTLTDGNELSDVQSDEGQDTNYMTRAYVFGSTRNLPTNYRKDSSQTVIDGVVETRLKLPEGISYVDAWDDLQDDDIVEGVIVLDDVYPRNTGTIATISTKEYTDETENEDGTKTYEKWNAYRFTDSGLQNFKDSYRIADEDLRIVFQSGSLAGMDFVVNFNPDGKPETDTASQVFEIVRNEDYGIALPSDTFKPKVGDTYILYGYNTQYVYDNLVTKAEQELYTKAVAKVAELSADKNVYTCETNPLRCAGYTPDAKGRMVYTAANEIDLDVGQSVRLESTALMDSGYRMSRVRAFEKRLDNKYNCTYTIGESSIYSRSEDLQEQVDEITYKSQTYTSTGGSSVYVVKRYDTTAPSDTNVPSFKRAQYEFLQRNVENRAAEKIGFDKGADFGTYKEGVQGGRIDGNGNAEFSSLDVRNNLEAHQMATLDKGAQFGDKFVTGLVGRGGRIDGDGNGELRSLRLWEFLEVPELRYNRVSVYTGVEWHTNGGGIIESVQPDTDTLTGVCKLKLEDGETGAVAEGDMCMGIYHNYGGSNDTETEDSHNGNFHFAGFSTVYFLIDRTGYIDDSGAFVADSARKEAFTYILRNDGEWTQTNHPQPQMHFAQYAHATDKTRQACVYSTTEYTIGLRNMTTWTYGSANIYKIDGNLDGFSLTYYDFSLGKETTKSFSGYGCVFADLWVTSMTVNSQLFNTLRMNISYDGQTTLDYGESLPVTCQLCIQMTPVSDLEDFASKTWVWSVTRNTGDTASDAVWNANAKAKAFAKNTTSEASIEISFKDGDNDLGKSANVYSTIFTFKAHTYGDSSNTVEATINI